MNIQIQINSKFSRKCPKDFGNFLIQSVCKGKDSPTAKVIFKKLEQNGEIYSPSQYINIYYKTTITKT